LFSITLPLIRPALLVAVIFRALDALRVFDLIYVLTAASSETMSVSIYARQELVEFQDVGLGSAAATLVFVLIALLTVAYIMLARLHVAAEERA
jgi:trehalose/maltose transport system permease protein